MAKKVRTEGDYAYYDDGTVRWASGNSQGKAAGSYAVLPHTAAERFDVLPAARRTDLARQGGTARWERSQAAVRRGMLEYARAIDPDIQTDEDAVAHVAEAVTVTAGSPDSKRQVQAFEALMKHAGYVQPRGPSVDARKQILIVSAGQDELDRLVDRFDEDE